MNDTDFSYYDCYVSCLERIGFSISPDIRTCIKSIIDITHWDKPISGFDWNNIGVLALIQSTQSEEKELQEIYYDMALNAFTEGFEEDYLCKAHWVLLHFLINQSSQAQEIGLSSLLELQPTVSKNSSGMGLIYFPQQWYSRAVDRDVIDYIFDANNREEQANMWLASILARAQLVFYSPVGRHFLNLWVHLNSKSAIANLQLGLAQIMNQQWEGLLFLHQAHRLNSNSLSILHGLYITYLDLGQIEIAKFYFEQAQSITESPTNKDSLWTTVPSDSPFSYILFDKDIALTVQPSLKSIVTGVLLAEGDWFEREMEFWRNWLKPGMTVIDVGANVGVYAFSAARQVGKEGQVIAIEPFSKCVECLQETRRINKMDWVSIYEAAASDRDGTIRLSVQGASELNEVIADENLDALAHEQYTKVSCMRLDSLIEQDQIQTVHIMKLDAEGHELNVLRGCEKILATFKPLILYENIAGSQGSNTVVADYLQQNGYTLHTYQPFIQQLARCTSNISLEGQLNLIAVPSN
jgi:FkbM family methyltransferase